MILGDISKKKVLFMFEGLVLQETYFLGDSGYIDTPKRVLFTLKSLAFQEIYLLGDSMYKKYTKVGLIYFYGLDVT